MYKASVLVSISVPIVHHDKCPSKNSTGQLVIWEVCGCCCARLYPLLSPWMTQLMDCSRRCWGRFGSVLLRTLLCIKPSNLLGKTTGSLLKSSVVTGKLGLMSCETERGGSVFVQVLSVEALHFGAGIQIGVSVASLCIQ